MQGRRPEADCDTPSANCVVDAVSHAASERRRVSARVRGPCLTETARVIHQRLWYTD